LSQFKNALLSSDLQRLSVYVAGHWCNAVLRFCFTTAAYWLNISLLKYLL